jgi:hypothetical protein
MYAMELLNDRCKLNWKKELLNLAYYPSILKEVLRKITKYFRILAVPAKFIEATAVHISESTPLEPTCSLAQYYLRHNETKTSRNSMLCDSCHSLACLNCFSSMYSGRNDKYSQKCVYSIQLKCCQRNSVNLILLSYWNPHKYYKVGTLEIHRWPCSTVSNVDCNVLQLDHFIWQISCVTVSGKYHVMAAT